MQHTSPPSSRQLRRRLESIALLGLLLILLGALFDWSWFKGPIERRVQRLTGREFVIGGGLGVELGRRLIVRAEQVRLGNAEWCHERQMARSDKLELKWEGRPLWHGQLVVP